MLTLAILVWQGALREWWLLCSLIKYREVCSISIIFNHSVAMQGRKSIRFVIVVANLQGVFCFLKVNANIWGEHSFHNKTEKMNAKYSSQCPLAKSALSRNFHCRNEQYLLKKWALKTFLFDKTFPSTFCCIDFTKWFCKNIKKTFYLSGDFFHFAKLCESWNCWKLSGKVEKTGNWKTKKLKNS